VSTLGPLLEVQAVDLKVDRLREKRAKLPARAALAANEAERATLDGERQAAQAHRDELARSERELGGEVTSIASKAKEVEKSLYSGSITIPKELDALHHALETWQRKQEEIEERELELLEQIENADSALGQQQTREGELGTTAHELSAGIAAAESAIDEEVVGLKKTGAGLRDGLPAAALTLYDRLRGTPRLAGRAAVALVSVMCEGCRLDLPVLEYRRLRDEPDDAIISCVHCTRMLIR
jgi:predicted  nucleic acid-binding Zn-ribbon protein